MRWTTSLLHCQPMGPHCRKSVICLLLLACGLSVICLAVLQQGLPIASGHFGLGTPSLYRRSSRQAEKGMTSQNAIGRGDLAFIPIGPQGILLTEKMQTNIVEEALFYYMMMPGFSCKEIHRLGGHGDGGWDVCIDEPYKPNKSDCLVYSFGMKDNWSFDDAVALAYGCEVHSFNPSVNLVEHEHVYSLKHHKIGVAGEDTNNNSTGWKLRTLGSIKEMLNHTQRDLDILKVDVEGSEWEVIPNMIHTGILDNVKQFCFELHMLALHRRRRAGLFEVYFLLKSLSDAGLKLFYTQINKGTSYDSPLTKKKRHSCMKFYFVNTAKLSS